MKNSMRAGLPPKLPDYVAKGLWRGERLALTQLLDSLPDAEAAADGESTATGAAPAPEARGHSVDKLLCGLTWRLPQGTAGPGIGYDSIVIDLSALLYDESFNKIDEVSWMNLSCAGATHSGDWYGQLGMSGGDVARETIMVDLPQLDPRVKYLLRLMCIASLYAHLSTCVCVF
jgi:hypothetical protein